jgi:HEAT repeat protein
MRSMKPILLAATLAATLLSPRLTAQEPTPLVTRNQAQLLAVLKSDASRKEKADACRELAVIGGPEAVPVLVGLLANPELNHMARYALETMPDPAVSAALREQLGRLKGRPLVGVIGSLGARKDLAAVEPLTRLLWDSDREVVQNAALALGRLGTPGALEALLNGISGAAPEDFPAFVEGIGRAAEALLAAGRTADVLPLFDRYADPDLPHHVRAAALRGALLARGHEGPGLLREVLRSPEYVLFAAAVQTSHEMPGPEVTRALAEALPAQPSPDRQVVVAGALGHRGDRAALPALTTAAAVSDKTVQLAALKALAMLGADEALPTFQQRLNDPDRAFAQAAREGLASLPGRAADEAILALLKSDSAAAQQTGIELAGRRRLSAAVPVLLALARQGEPPVRAAALRQVGELGGEKEVATLLDLLLAARDSGDIAAAQQALLSLAGQSAPAAVTAKVIPALTRAAPAVRAALLEVLAALGGPEALQAVRAACNDPDAETRGAAIRALSSWKTADAAPALLELATKAGNETDRRLALGGYLTLAGNSDLPADQRLEMCRHAAHLVQQPADKNRLLAALGQIASLDTLDLIAPHLDDTATRNEAAAALVAVADKLVRSDLPAPGARRLAEALDKAAGSVNNADLARRARNLAEQARKKAGS